jgi:hypothetical protein
MVSSIYQSSLSPMVFFTDTTSIMKSEFFGTLKLFSSSLQLGNNALKVLSAMEANDLKLYFCNRKKVVLTYNSKNKRRFECYLFSNSQPVMINPFTDEYFMKKVLNEAEMALKRWNLVGVVVINNIVIARSHNLTDIEWCYCTPKCNL